MSVRELGERWLSLVCFFDCAHLSFLPGYLFVFVEHQLLLGLVIVVLYVLNRLHFVAHHLIDKALVPNALVSLELSLVLLVSNAVEVGLVSLHDFLTGLA